MTDNKKINTKSELVDLINGMIGEFRSIQYEVTLSDLIGNATSLEEATKNTLYAFSHLVRHFPAMKMFVVQSKYRKHINDNLDIEAIYKSCYEAYSAYPSLDEFIAKHEKMNKLELQMAINRVEKAIDDYFLLTTVKTMSTWVTLFRLHREYLEMYITDGKFLVRSERINNLHRELDERIEYCMNSVPSHVKIERCRHGEIDRTFITVKDKLTGKEREFKTDEDAIMDYNELLQFVNKDNENSSYEIIAIAWFSPFYVKRELEYPIMKAYHYETLNLHK